MKLAEPGRIEMDITQADERTGQLLGEWRIHRHVSQSASRSKVYVFVCKCGAEKTATFSYMLSKQKKGQMLKCADCQIAERYQHLVGAEHGAREIQRLIFKDVKRGSRVRRSVFAVCRCQCGDISEVRVDQISDGKSLKCNACNAKKRGWWIDRHGYVAMVAPDPNHPNARANGVGSPTILQHTWVMSQHLGKPLLPHENVHHKNGDRTDNRLENLELWDTSQPKGQRVSDKIEHYRWFLEIHGLKVLPE